ncbi:hypothetical protein LguiB_017518 [Lonicera macranthoides]
MRGAFVTTAAEYQRRGEKFFDELEIAFADVLFVDSVLVIEALKGSLVDFRLG